MYMYIYYIYRYSHTPAGGQALELYIDIQTWHLTRLSNDFNLHSKNKFSVY